ncbi:hypothetical protein LNQ81_00740 [Myroides sp. M-43]|uniref:hypothetical protein n=1 Tax=Myroides oncorhynchi TaxID=2893756 RepID=UPI001E37D46D|nr:hypothetical protein [Myroides oncorhynchi]MCC9041266.1 hypothetical protein [Myroides oncorhynchi]
MIFTAHFLTVAIIVGCITYAYLKHLNVLMNEVAHWTIVSVPSVDYDYCVNVMLE